ncbi:hypothetical protein LI168_15765 [Desulfovibrio desulfuricans]|nr:hypothetical protein [Desulfovibrio desulfuricans]MCB6543592.1 hypothetical protein [Desulfovibrio desulfuricans]MCB6554672.1 hypothetical protein [Desulfovibrio desulfuricans]MCB6566524.1 hypothetical protein [Desulfovibrio desulfuricans]MCB7347222.1 hypothetical protein [Desulfovibrio desulfuricans]MCQ5219298.1 hypothetical protein [Desulfovibrio desulfuricans]
MASVFSSLPHILTGLCILSAYLHHAFVELKGRPRYLLAETLEGDKTDA